MIQATASAAPVTLRDVRASDAQAMQAYLAALDADSRGLRFHGGIDPSSTLLLRLLTNADGVRRLGMVALRALDDGEIVVGEVQCAVAADGISAEFAISVAIDQRGSGLAARLLAAVTEAAAARGVLRLQGDVLARNARMAAFMSRQGFVAATGDDCEPGVVCFTRCLRPARSASGRHGAWWRRLLELRSVARRAASHAI